LRRGKKPRTGKGTGCPAVEPGGLLFKSRPNKRHNAWSKKNALRRGEIR